MSYESVAVGEKKTNTNLENNSAIGFLLEMPLRGFSFHIKVL